MKKTTALVLGALLAGAAFAETTPVLVSLVDPLQVPTRDYDVKGLRLSFIYGACDDFKGLDLGIANYSTGGFTGLALGGVNIVDGRVLGGQVGLVDCNSFGGTEWENRPIGAQIGLFNYADEFCGLQNGIVNVSGTKFTGLQAGFLNFANDLDGVSLGGYLIFGVNVASGTVKGVQIGLVNYAERMEKGVQIGLVNIISQNGWMPVFPIVNGSF